MGRVKKSRVTGSVVKGGTGVKGGLRDGAWGKERWGGMVRGGI